MLAPIRVAEQAHHRAGGRPVGKDLIEQEGAGHARLVDQDDVAGAQLEVLIDGLPPVGAAAAVKPGVQGVGAAAEVIGEDFRRAGGRRERDQPTARRVHGAGHQPHRCRLARAHGAETGQQQLLGVGEGGGQRALAGVHRASVQAAVRLKVPRPTGGMTLVRAAARSRFAAARRECVV